MAHPRWLEARDEVWLRELASELAACEGLTARETDERVVDASFRLARHHGVERRVVEAVWEVERRRHQTYVDSPLPPPRVREVLFELAADLEPADAMEEAARRLGVAPSRLPALLFADRAQTRRFRLSREAPTERMLLEQVNRAIAESLVVRTTEVVARVRGHLRRVVGVARLRGLMLRAEEDPGGTKLTVSGPLALFHETLKYGRALASWLHTLAVTPGWSLEGRARLCGRELAIRLDASSPIPRVRELSRATDSKIEARLARDLRRHAPDVRFARESQGLRVGGAFCFPDFALTFEDATVLVEIVGFWTPEYLAAKAELAARADHPLVLCVDARHAKGELAPRPGVVPFERHVDVRALLDACAAVRARWRSDRPPVAPPARPPVPEVLRHVLLFNPSPSFARFAVAAGASSERWAEEIAADIVRGSALETALLEAHPVYGPQLLLVGERFLARAGQDRRRRDALFVNAIWSRRAAGGLPATHAVPVEIVEPTPAAALAGDDVSCLFERISRPPAPDARTVAQGRHLL